MFARLTWCPKRAEAATIKGRDAHPQAPLAWLLRFICIMARFPSFDLEGQMLTYQTLDYIL